MNRDNIQITIEVLKRAENFHMRHFQATKLDAKNKLPVFQLAKTEAELHACGNTACIAGYLALSPEWAEWGGIQDGGVPLRHYDDSPHRALADFWGVSQEVAGGLIFGQSKFWTLLQRLGAPNMAWMEMRKEDAIAVFEAMLANEDIVDELSGAGA